VLAYIYISYDVICIYKSNTNVITNEVSVICIYIFSYNLQARTGEYEFFNKQSGEMYKADKVVRVIHNCYTHQCTF